MRRIATAMMAVAVVLFAAGLSAQGQPSFAGKWTMDQPAGGAAAGGGGGGGGRGGGGRGGGGGGFACGPACEITQDATTLTVSRTGQDGTVTKMTFKLDGTDSKNSVMGRGGAATDVVSKAKWDGNALVISTTLDMGGTPVTATQKVTMEGGKMTIESNSGREGATPMKTTYTKG